MVSKSIYIGNYFFAFLKCTHTVLITPVILSSQIHAADFVSSVQSGTVTPVIHRQITGTGIQSSHIGYISLKQDCDMEAPVYNIFKSKSEYI